MSNRTSQRSQNALGNSRRFGWAAAAAVAGLGWGGAAFGQAGATVGTFSVRVNNGAVHTVQCFASAGAEAGSSHFQGATVDAGGDWEASWDYMADLDPNGNAQLIGVATILNKSAIAADFDVSFEAPICPYITSGAKMGGSCIVKLTASANGGSISTAPGNQVFGALADDAVTAKLFHGPFNMGTTGSGTAQTMNAFGAPFPGYNVGAVTSDFGVRHIFKLTDGDTAAITSAVILGGEPANFVACPQAQQAQALPAEGSPAPQDAPPAIVPSAPVAPPSFSNSPSSSSVTLGGNAANKKLMISAGPTAGNKAVRKAPAPPRRPAASSASSGGPARKVGAPSDAARQRAAALRRR